MPRVSVIIPTFNRGHLISRAIDSVFMQTFKDFEIIVIDDGSTDKTRDVLKAYEGRIKYIYQDHKGISAARNCGIQEAAGQYIAFLDSDDEWVKEKLEVQVKILDKNPDIGIIHNKLVILNERGEKVGMKPERESGRNFRELVAIGGDLPTSSVITRRECFQKAGMFDEKLPTMEDFEMWIRISRSWEIHEIRDKCLAYSHRHNEQITKDQVQVHYGLVEMDRKILRSFPDIPIQKVHKRLAANEYRLSRIYFDKRQYRQAFDHLKQAMKRDPLVGVSIGGRSKEWSVNAFKVIKTYIYFCLSGLTSLIAKE